MYFHFEDRNYPLYMNTFSRLTFQPHIHSHIEMIFVFSGESESTADSKTELLEKGDIFIAFPNQIHYYRDLVAPKGIMLLFLPELAEEFGHIFNSKIPVSPVIKNVAENQKIKSAVDELWRIYKEGHPFAEALMRAYLLIIMTELLPNISFEDAPKYDSDILKSVIKYCGEHFSQDISLQDIADNLHVSRYYISHLFGKRLKVKFSDYINSLRIRRACELLKQDSMSVIEIGFAVGYNSARSFNRCFKSIKGVSPKEYRKEQRNAVQVDA